MTVTISESTLDDLLREVISLIFTSGVPTRPTKGATLDTFGVALSLGNPRARLSRTEGRGRLFSCLGEFCWYLSGSNDVEPVAHYIPAYRSFQENGKIHGGYGPRLFEPAGASQVEYVLSQLRQNQYSRKAVIQLFDRADVETKHEDVPCTCTLQFLIREERLHLVTYMRSNDAWLGLPHDVFCFTMLQEMIATSLGLPLGKYTHFVGSLHLYERNIEEAKAFLEEGWQSTVHQMPPMPNNDPWLEAARMVDAERRIREGNNFNLEDAPGSTYWDDLIRILWIHTLGRQRDKETIQTIRASMESQTFDIFIADRLAKL